ncbi:FG-GAP-like repeat-containing protein [Dapis sp. BLCC M229]|uniref:FG-GAP-like repeat-containing protein n=1 Tax=Dapis sp. BLCC M229 TaxID=3400188 RepID=UPI003CE9B2D5
MPVFLERTGTANPLNGVDVGDRSKPTFADIDGDGDLDAFIGEEDGNINYFENDGSGSFSEVTGSGNPLNGVNVGGWSTPTFADIDGDGDLDAFIGELDGNINYFENNGSGSFSEVTGSGNPLNGVDVGLEEGRSAPTFADIDGDGDLDAFIGNGEATIDYFENDGSGSFSQVTGSGNPLNAVNVGFVSNPTFADIDGDGDLDAFIGEGKADITYFENDGSGNFSEVTGSGNPLDDVDVSDSAPTFADIDGDGDLDAFIGNASGEINYFENLNIPPGGNFVDSGQALGNAISSGVDLGDVDGDGDLDAFIANIASSDKVWLNDGSGTFTDSGQTLGNDDSAAVNLGDLDGDGDLDAFVATSGYYGGPNKVWFNDGSGNFTDSGQSLGNNVSDGVNLGDLDGDGDLDAFVANYSYYQGSTSQVWINNGAGVFTAGSTVNTSGYTEDVTLGDLDGDGDLDAFVVTGESDEVWINNGSGTFTNSGQSLGNSSSEEVALGDIDGDSDLDAVVASPGGNGVVWLNNGSGTFTNSGQSVGNVATQGVELGDVDLDGDLDIALANTAGSNTVLVNDGSGTFTDSGQSLGSSSNSNIQLGDLDGDGDLDRFLGSIGSPSNGFNGGPNEVWFNEELPNAVDDAVTTDEDSLLSGNVLTNDGDGENDPLTVTEVNGNAADVGSQVTLPSGALLTLNIDGTFDYDPNGKFESLNNGETASDSFTYTIDDGNGGTDTATVNVTIDGVTDNTAPPNSLESDYTIFSSNISGTEYTVELANSQPVYTIDGTATNQSLNDFLTEAVLELGGTVVRNGTINENSLEHFGGNQNPSITENEGVDKVTIKIAGSGVGGQYKADFDNDADANAFQAFAKDLLGKDPTKTKIFQFNGGTNGGANNIRILTNDEIVSLNPELSDGLRTTDSLDFKWSGADTPGTQVRNNFDDFIGEMGDLFGGDQLTNADIHVIPTLNEAELTGTEVAISNGIGDTETWNFGNEQKAQNFLTFFDSTVDAFAV